MCLFRWGVDIQICTDQDCSHQSCAFYIKQNSNWSKNVKLNYRKDFCGPGMII